MGERAAVETLTTAPVGAGGSPLVGASQERAPWARSRRWRAAVGLVLVGLCAAAALLAARSTVGAATLEEVEVIHSPLQVQGQEPVGGPWNADVVEPAYGSGKLDAMGVNLDHWAWDVHPPRNGAFNPRGDGDTVEEAAPLQLLRQGNLVIRDFETPRARLYRHAASDHNSGDNVVSVRDIVADPNILFGDDEAQE